MSSACLRASFAPLKLASKACEVNGSGNTESGRPFHLKLGEFLSWVNRSKLKNWHKICGADKITRLLEGDAFKDGGLRMVICWSSRIASGQIVLIFKNPTAREIFRGRPSVKRVLCGDSWGARRMEGGRAVRKESRQAARRTTAAQAFLMLRALGTE